MINQEASTILSHHNLPQTYVALTGILKNSEYEYVVVIFQKSFFRSELLTFSKRFIILNVGNRWTFGTI